MVLVKTQEESLIQSTGRGRPSGQTRGEHYLIDANSLLLQVHSIDGRSPSTSKITPQFLHCISFMLVYYPY